MKTEQLLSLKEMAKELDTTWQSIRSWKEQYYPFIPMEVEGKQVRFKLEAIEVLRSIQEAKGKGMDHHEIRAQLAERTGQALQKIAASEIPEKNHPIDRIMADPNMMEEMQQTIWELQKEVNELKAKFSEVEVAKRDQALMDNLREIRDSKKPKKGLWSRVMNFTL